MAYLPQLQAAKERQQQTLATGKREQMATQEAKQVYRRRGATAEWVNAQVRQHGVSQFTVRGLAKVTTVMILVAVAPNLLRWVALWLSRHTKGEGSKSAGH